LYKPKERAEKFLLEYQRVWAEINLDNIAHNTKLVRKNISEKTKIMGIVKADAYGHGCVEVSKTLLFNGVDMLGAAIVDEGVLIRKNNILEEVLILGYTPPQKLSEVALYGLTQTVFSFDMAQNLSDIAKKLNKPVDIHIKVDSGMGRLGFLPSGESVKEIIKISQMPFINITGIYTHFAESNKLGSPFTGLQFNIFTDFLDKLSPLNIRAAHCSNSGAILANNKHNLDIVRAGVILYGLLPSDDFSNFDLRPAMSLKTQISYIKELPKGASVGYGRTYFTSKKTKIATIPVGYADGYLRSMGNKGRVLINGEFADVTGGICMDQFMVDVTHIEGAAPGDLVVLFGSQSGAEITINEVAALQGTINYEIVCNIGKRVPRAYMKNNRIMKTITHV
jgi:alanine racemase